MRKYFTICLVLSALILSVETFCVKMVSAETDYNFKTFFKFQTNPLDKSSLEKPPKETPKPTPKPAKINNDTTSNKPADKKTAGSNPPNAETAGGSEKPETPAGKDEKEDEKIKGNAEENISVNDTNKTVKPKSDGWFGGIWTLLLWLVGGIAGLAVVGGIGWRSYSLFTNAFDKERKATQHGFRMAEKNSKEVSRRIEELEKTVKLQSNQFTQMQTAIKSLQRQVSEVGGQAYKAEAEIYTPSVYQPEPKFPVSAEDYLAKNSEAAQTATADLIGGLLINDINKGNEFLIVNDSELSDGLFYAIPNQSRFNTKGEYLNFYQNYYAFENPSSGAIQIKSPTIVKRTEGGWKLVQMGELEVR